MSGLSPQAGLSWLENPLGAADTLLLGREAAGGEDAAMGKALGDAHKIEVSNQNLQFTWRNTEQLQGDLVEAVTALKNEPGATDIAMSGSVSIVRQLLAAGLLDELHLLVHPIAARKGMRPFDEANPRSRYGSPPPRPSPPRFAPHLRPGRISCHSYVRRRKSAPAPT